MRDASKFGRGSGVYVCACCKRRTRQTGGYNDTLQLCEECYEIAGQENALSDNGTEWEGADNAKAEIERLKTQCRVKGGQIA